MPFARQFDIAPCRHNCIFSRFKDDRAAPYPISFIFKSLYERARFSRTQHDRCAANRGPAIKFHATYVPATQCLRLSTVRGPGSRDGGSICRARAEGQVPMLRFIEPTQPSGPRSVIDRAEDLIDLSDTCLYRRCGPRVPGTPKRRTDEKASPRGIRSR